jgi:ubiquitin-protein ligase
MNLSLIRNQYEQAKQYFSYIELNPTAEGKVYVRAAIQPVSQQYYILSIQFPDNYPNQMPTVYVDKPALNYHSPHRYKNGNLCYLHPTMWNPGMHNLTFVIERAAKWLSKYEIWKLKKVWPGAEIKH